MRGYFRKATRQGAVLALGLVAEVFSASTTTDCTVFSTTTTTDSFTLPPSTVTSIVTQTLVATTYYVTPFSNGTTSTRTEFARSARHARIAKRTVWSDPSLATVTSQPYSNITATVSPSFTQTPTAADCETLTVTNTVVVPITLPGETIIQTFTTIRATTLFDYKFLTPATFEPTATRSAGLTSALEPLPVQTPTSQPPAATNRPSASPEPTRLSESFVGQPPPTPQDPARTSGAPAVPPNQEPQVTSTPIATIPGIGPINLPPSNTGIFVPNAPTPPAPGQSTTLGTIPISLDTPASFVVIDNTQTIPLPANLQPGHATLVNGITISLDPPSSFLIIDNTQTIPLPAPTPQANTLAISSILSNLQPGHATLINGITLSLDPASSFLIIGTSTIGLSAAPTAVIFPAALPSDFSFVSASAGGGVLLPDGETLAPGQATTYAGVPVSLASGTAGVVVVDGTVSITVAGSAGGGAASSTGTAGDAEFTGGATPGAGVQTGWGECMVVAALAGILPRLY